MVALDVLWIMIVSSFVVGFVQGLTGFGAAILMMAFLPLYFGVLESSAIVGMVTLVLSLAMVWVHRKHINIKLTLLPALIYITTSTLSILYAQQLQSAMLSIIFGLFLIALSLYFLFAEPDGFALNKHTSFLFIAISGVTNGLFGIGGPLMVIYYLSKIKNKREYLGTIQFFFTIGSILSAAVRFSTGILVGEHLPLILIGIIAILVGLTLANRVIENIQPEKLRRFIYLFIGLSGVYNIITVLG